MSELPILEEFDTLTDVKFEKEILEAHGLINEEKVENAKAGEAKWHPVGSPNSDDFKASLDSIINLVKDIPQTVLTPARAIIELARNILKFIPKEINFIEETLKLLKEEIDKFIADLLGMGRMHMMYILPVNMAKEFDARGALKEPEESQKDKAKQKSKGDKDAKVKAKSKFLEVFYDSQRKFSEFWNIFDKSFEAKTLDEKLFVPVIGKDEYVWAFSLLMVAPGVEEIITNFKKVLNFFNMPILFKNEKAAIFNPNLDSRDLIVFEPKIKSYFQLELGLPTTTIVGFWNKLYVPHKIIYTIHRKDLKSGKLEFMKDSSDNIAHKDEEIYNIEDNYRKDTTAITIRSAKYRSEYTFKVDIFTDKDSMKILSLGRGDENHDKFVSNKNARNGHSKKKEDYTERLGTFIKTVKVPNEFTVGKLVTRAKSNYGNAQWIGLTLETLFPQVIVLKQQLSDLVNRFFKTLVDSGDSIERLANVLDKKIDKLENAVRKIETSSKLFLDKFSIELDDKFVYTKHIDFDKMSLGTLKGKLKSMDGIPSLIQKNSNFVAGFFIMISGKEPSLVKLLIDLFEMAFPKPSEPEGTAKLEKDKNLVANLLTIKNEFNMNGQPSDFLGLLQ